MIILRGAGRAFCSGYDLKEYAEGGTGTQDAVRDPIKGFQRILSPTGFWSPGRERRQALVRSIRLFGCPGT